MKRFGVRFICFQMWFIFLGQAVATREVLYDRMKTAVLGKDANRSVKTTESGGRSGYDAGKKVKRRKHYLVVDVEGLPIKIAAHEAPVQGRDGVPAVILGMLETMPHVTKLRADGGYQGPKLASALKDLGIGPVLEIVNNPKDIKATLSPLGRGADLRLDVAPPSGEGL